MTEFRKEFVSPEGVIYVARTAAEAVDLQFGRGYKEKGAANLKRANNDKPEKAPPPPPKDAA
jgi:hypothetical protein